MFYSLSTCDTWWKLLKTKAKELHKLLVVVAVVLGHFKCILGPESTKPWGHQDADEIIRGASKGSRLLSKGSRGIRSVTGDLAKWA